MSELPFTWTRLALDNEEEEVDVELVQAWVVDLPDPKYAATMLKWLKQSNLDKNDDALAHLKRIRRRRSPDQNQLLLLLLDTSSPYPPPVLPPDLLLASPYLAPVPRYPARTLTSLALKNAFWPTLFCPNRKWEPEPFSIARVRWAEAAVERLKAAYANLVDDGELPVVAHVPQTEDDVQLPRSYFGYDTRTSSKHPLRHAVLDVIRQVADDRAQRSSQEHEQRNGSQYLLTGLSLFVTHEPCIMCSMALLHSRVKQVFYLVPMPQTGGCGGTACVPALRGVNHRFTIGVWKQHDPSDDDWPAPLHPAIDV